MINTDKMSEAEIAKAFPMLSYTNVVQLTEIAKSLGPTAEHLFKMIPVFRELKALLPYAESLEALLPHFDSLKKLFDIGATVTK